MKKLLLFMFLGAAFNLTAQDQMYDICPLKVGEELPMKVRITDDEGKKQTLKNVLDDKPTVLVFYRGGWCPYCTRQLSGLQEAKSQIDSLGFQVIAVCPDDFTKLDSSIRESGAKYQLYSDNQVELIEAFGLGWKIDDELYLKYTSQYGLDTEIWSGEKHHVLPVPAVYIIKDNEIKFNYINPEYSQRLEPETLIAILKTI